MKLVCINIPEPEEGRGSKPVLVNSDDVEAVREMMRNTFAGAAVGNDLEDWRFQIVEVVDIDQLRKMFPKQKPHRT